MSIYGIQLRDVPTEPYFQRYFDTRPMAATRGELFTRPDTAQPTEQFFNSLRPKEHLRVLEWLLDVAAQVLQHTGMHASINVDPAIMASPVARNDFLRVAAAAQSAVTFEFGELPSDWSNDEVNAIFTQIRERGHFVALDNFGRGEPDLDLLRQLRVDAVKIAGSLTSRLDNNAEMQDALAGVYMALTNAGLGHVVQGVESQAAFQWLRDVGFTTFQGYWFSIPAPADSLQRV